MMILLQDIPKEGLDLEYTESPEKFGFTKASFPEAISISLHITKEGEEVLVQGKIVAREILQCSRCLGEAVNPIQAVVRMGYAPLAQVPRAEEVQLQREDLDVIFYQEDRIELSDLVRGQILLARPIRLLCKADCRGLCQVCGQDLNVRTCDCVTETSDPRFSVLMQFKRASKKR